MLAEAKDLDVVKIKDGRECTILETFIKPEPAYYVEFSETDGDFGIITPDDIVEIIARYT